jgi:hypothetical protein
MEGIVKSAPISSDVTKAPTHITTDMPMMLNDVPVDLLMYFDLDANNLSQRAKFQLNNIYNLLRNKFETMGDMLQEIKRVERHLGPSPLSDTRYGRVHNWVKITERIEELNKQRQSISNG